MEQKFFKCEICGNIYAQVSSSGVPVVCCGKPMTEIKANSTDAAVEKHVPVYKVEGNKVTVTVGSVEHPMLEEHFIEWIALETKTDAHYLIHAIGSWGYTWVRDEIAQKGTDLAKHPNIDVRDYIYDMPSVMAAADLVLCRGGAATAAELEVMGKPAVIVPSPNVAENHQEKNARALEAAGGAVVMLESETTGESLFAKATELLSDSEKLRRMGESMHKLAKPDAIGRIYDCIRKTASGN